MGQRSLLNAGSNPAGLNGYSPLELLKESSMATLQREASRMGGGMISDPNMQDRFSSSLMAPPPSREDMMMGGEQIMGMMPMAGITAFHGSRSAIPRFNKSMIRADDYDVPVNGFWFASRPENAQPAFHSPTNIMPVDITLNNPAPWDKIRQVSQQVRKDGTLRQGARSFDDETRYRLQDMGHDGVIADGFDRSMIDVDKLNRTGTVNYLDVRGNKKSLKYTKEDGLGMFDGYGAKDEGHITGFYDLDDMEKTLGNKDYIVFEPSQIRSQFSSTHD
jgi:hypothetical protein